MDIDQRSTADGLLAVKTIVAAASLACVLHAGAARAQSVTTEAAASTGFSTDESISAVGAQLRAFGELTSGIRFFTEASLRGRFLDAEDELSRRPSRQS